MRSASADIRRENIERRHCRIGKWKPKRWSRHRVKGLFAATTDQLMREVGR